MRREALATIEAQLAQKLTQEGLPIRVISRVKAPWSIYSKMREENKSFDQVMDVFGFRVVVQKVMQCYHALGAVHSLFKPLDAKFRDFIAIPKANGYQSLHTLLFGPYGSPVEVQIGFIKVPDAPATARKFVPRTGYAAWSIRKTPQIRRSNFWKT